MTSLTEWLRLNFRICLSATLMIEAAIGLLPRLQDCTLPSVVGGMNSLGGMSYHSSALSALYFVLSIWLVLGIRTAATAGVAAILLLVPAILTTPHGDPELAVKITLVTIFAVPLVMYGGGRYSVYDPREPWMPRDAETQETA